MRRCQRARRKAAFWRLCEPRRLREWARERRRSFSKPFPSGYLLPVGQHGKSSQSQVDAYRFPARRLDFPFRDLHRHGDKPAIRLPAHRGRLHLAGEAQGLPQFHLPDDGQAHCFARLENLSQAT